MTQFAKTFRSFAYLALLSLFALSFSQGAYAQTDPSGQCQNVDQASTKPIFLSGSADTVWACNPLAGGKWVRIYPAAGLTSASPSAFSANDIVGDSAMRVAHATYNFAVDGGATSLITPKSNFFLPINSVIWGCYIQWTTAPLPSSSNTVSFGLTGTGGGAAILSAATATSGLTVGVFQQCAVVPQTASGIKKITTANGTATLTPATSALTAGVAEIYVLYYKSST